MSESSGGPRSKDNGHLKRRLRGRLDIRPPYTGRDQTMFEATTLLAVMAEVTERIRIGCLVHASGTRQVETVGATLATINSQVASAALHPIRRHPPTDHGLCPSGSSQAGSGRQAQFKPNA
jgi:hypothetical protein